MIERVTAALPLKVSGFIAGFDFPKFKKETGLLPPNYLVKALRSHWRPGWRNIWGSRGWRGLGGRMKRFT